MELSKAFHSSSNALFIVVIDDSAVVCRILEVLLTKEGHQVQRFQDPVSAIRALLITGETPLPDLFFIDLSMPTLSGYEVTQCFKKHPASMHIPIIVISRLDDTVARLKARLAGAAAYLPKPFEVQDLFTLVRSFAERPNAPSSEK